MRSKQRRQNGQHRGTVESNVKTSDRSALGHLCGPRRVVNAAQDVQCLFEKSLTCRRKRDPVLRPGNQHHTELSLERRDLLAQRRLDDVKPLRCTAEVHVLGNCDEVAKVAELHVPMIFGGRAKAAFNAASARVGLRAG